MQLHTCRLYPPRTHVYKASESFGGTCDKTGTRPSREGPRSNGVCLFDGQSIFSAEAQRGAACPCTVERHDAPTRAPSRQVMSMFDTRTRVTGLLSVGLVLAFAASGCGGSSSSTSSNGTGKTGAPASQSSSEGASGSSEIPQNNGGDQDADNNGGPSDGDGNL